MEEKVYNFELPHSEVELLKQALRYTGLEIYKVRAMYKKLCTEVCDKEDTEILARYE